MWLGEIPALKKTSGASPWLVRIAAIIIPLALAMAIVITHAPESSPDPYDYGY